ncbi:MAG: hypothetical protein H6818_13895 [Phycisphaerales bacterium]|nr:hypothetical protein [Phycisphaerales bacterium]MCB9862105.1 hypothetical protein [Phycisphaerales bacterium]
MRRRTPRYLKLLQVVTLALWLTWGFSVIWSLELMSPKSSIGIANGCIYLIWKWPAPLKHYIPNECMLSRSDYVQERFLPSYESGRRVPATGGMTWPLIAIPIWILAIPLAVGVIYLRRRRPLLDDSPRCANCGFDLTGNESGICPECGTPTGFAGAEPSPGRSTDTRVT